MCLITKQKEAFIAEEDITVYKLLTNDASAIFQTFDYEIGRVYKENIEKSDLWQCFGALDNDWLYKTYGHDWFHNKDLISLGKGFHSIDTLETAKTVKKVICIVSTYSCIYKCTIPKGSEYFKNDAGFIISNSIIIDEKLKFKTLTNGTTRQL